jgi:hypothetical protein
MKAKLNRHPAFDVRSSRNGEALFQRRARSNNLRLVATTHALLLLLFGAFGPA